MRSRWKSATRGSIRQSLSIALVIVVTVAVLAAGFAWKKPALTRRLVDHLNYFATVDSRERVATRDDGFDVLLLVLDACRPAKLSAYGFERETTPNLAQLAQDQDAVRFQRHYANGNWTKPSTATLFTGLLVHEHAAFKSWEPSRGKEAGTFTAQVLSSEVETLAEMFAGQGYYTFGIVQAEHLEPEFGFAQGFDEYYGPADYFLDQSRTWATNALIRKIEGNYFGYVHLLACHQPFPENNRHEGYMQAYGFDYPEADRISQKINFTNTRINERINEDGLKLTEEDVRFLNLVYEAKARYMDERFVRSILDTLKETGRYDNTLVVVTGDHGEALYEHESYAHGGLPLWEEVVHVPLIVKFPKGKRPAVLDKDVNEVTSAVDLFPALADLLGRPAPEYARGSAIFSGEFPGIAILEGRTCVTELNDCLVSTAVLRDQYKLIDYPGQTLLFDLEKDPLEQNSIAEERPVLSGELQAAADRIRSESTSEFLARDIDTKVDEEALERLRGLGYVQ